MKSMLARRYRIFKQFKSKKCGSGVTDQATTCHRGVARSFKFQQAWALAGCSATCCAVNCNAAG